MEYYNIYLGMDRIQIEIEPKCIDFDNWNSEMAFDSMVTNLSLEFHDSYMCCIRCCSDVELQIKKQLCFFDIADTSVFFCGMYRDTYYTINREYGLFARTNINDKKILIDVKAHLISNKSMYFIRSIIREHALRLLFAVKKIPIHAAAVLDKTGHCLLIAGDSGVGKSSVTWHFLQQGYQLMSDDISVYLPNSRMISGCGSALYVRPDFVNRYPIFEYLEVSYNRKLRISVKNSGMSIVAPFGMILMKPYNEYEATWGKLDHKVAFEQFINIHSNWCRSSIEKSQLHQYSKDLIEQLPYIYTLRIGNNLETSITNIIEEINKSAE